jgi:hypothetical protein
MKPVKKGNPAIFVVFIILFIYSCDSTQTLYLSDIRQGFIANEFGPPGKDISFEKNKLSIRGKTFEKGLGVHAPAKIYLDINGQGIIFYASVGLDDEVRKTRSDSLRQSLTKTADYVYDGNLDLSDLKQGGTVRFHVSGDGNMLLSTGWLSENSPAQDIEVNIRGIKKLSLEVEKSPEGSFADHADWADARLTMKNKNFTEKLELYGSASDILLNQTGFLPVSFKTFRTSESGEQKEFSIIDMSTNKAVFSGAVNEKQGDWGKVYIGDFSAVKTPGKYYVQFGGKTSEPISISSLQYVYNLEKHLNWFLSQRCGDPEHGFERGQHRDDGVRLDNRKHQDVSGGWHDAADLRKWGMTINGLWALSETYLSLSSENVPDFGGKKELIAKIKDEFSWGNKYYSAMQEPQGYLMEQVGGDVYKHGDNNRFTDNISGTPDDRWIVTRPNEPVFQYMFVIAQCNMALTEKPELRSSYILKATKCFNWATENKIVTDIHSLGAAQTASLKLYEATGNDKYLTMAQDYLRLILERQDTVQRPAYGFIRSWKPGLPDTNNDYFPEENLSYLLITPDFPTWSIVESIRGIKDPDLNHKARKAFQLYVDHFISYFDEKSSYGIVPLALYRKNPGGNRKAGDYFYRWCYVNHEDKEWWNGINPRIGYAGALLVRGGMLTNNSKAIRIGQQQLDFIYGCNPFNASTATGLGYNQPDYFKTSEFVPHTPETVGAVMAGIGSSEEDQPVLLPGWWQTTEYWMEAVTGTVMLLNELNNYQFEKK